MILVSDAVNVLKTARRITLHLKTESRYGEINVLTVWHVFVIARQKQSNTERKAKENRGILWKKFLINLLQSIIYRTDIDVV